MQRPIHRKILEALVRRKTLCSIAVLAIATIINIPIHELGHAVTAAIMGMPIESITWITIPTTQEPVFGRVVVDVTNLDYINMNIIYASGGGLVLLLGIFLKEWFPIFGGSWVYLGSMGLMYELFGVIGASLIAIYLTLIFPQPWENPR